MNKFSQLLITLFVLSVFLYGCSGNDLPDIDPCENSDLAIETDGTDPIDCASKGSILITATLGKAPYMYSVDGGDFVADNLFEDLVAGSHVARIRDAKGCSVSEDVVLTIPTSSLEIDDFTIIDTDCGESEGGITVVATGGEAPYSYSLDNIDFSNTTGVFDDLDAGTYTIFVKDDEECTTSAANLKIETGVSYNDDIKPILQTNCIKSGCHNGDNGATINWSIFANVKAKAARIKEFTGNGTMPLDIAPTGLPQNQRDLIACWVDDGALNN